MDFHIVKMYKDKEVNKNVKIFFINVCRKSVFDIYFRSKNTSGDSEMVHDRCSTLLTEFGTALTTILPILFQYCYKYCYSDSRNL